MTLSRRGLIIGLGASLAAPAIIRTAGLIMPIKVIQLPNGMWLERDHGAGIEAAMYPGYDAVASQLYRLRDGLKTSPYVPLGDLRVAVRFEPRS